MLFHAKEIIKVVCRYSDHLSLILDDLGHRFAGNLGQFTLKVTHASLTGIDPHHQQQSIVGNAKFLGLQPMAFHHLGQQVLLGDFAFLVLCVARQGNNLHPVEQWPRHVVAVGCGQEHHVR